MAGEEAVGCMSKCTESGNSYNDCKDYCGAELQEAERSVGWAGAVAGRSDDALAFAQKAPITSTNVVTYGFAAVGASVLMFGAFRYYTSKSDYVELDMA